MEYYIIKMFLFNTICIALIGIARRIQQGNTSLVLLVIVLMILLYLYRAFI